MTSPATFLWLLTLLFALRVAGQALVAFAGAAWLPPMPEWYSGMVGYPILLPAQIAILALMAAMNLGVQRRRGAFSAVGVASTRWIRAFAFVYLAVMIGRYAVTMTLHPERRWLGGTIPIFFHWLLALYLLVFSHYHRVRAQASSGR